VLTPHFDPRDVAHGAWIPLSTLAYARLDSARVRDIWTVIIIRAVTRRKKGKSGGRYMYANDSMMCFHDSTINYTCRHDESIDARHTRIRDRAIDLSADIARKRVRRGREGRGGVKLCNGFYQLLSRSLPSERARESEDSPDRDEAMKMRKTKACAYAKRPSIYPSFRPSFRPSVRN
jgi:hypothetical protein